MSTHLIIDGYNVLGKRGQVGPNSEMAREQLVQELMRYRQRKGHAITVVFDGPARTGYLVTTNGIPREGYGRGWSAEARSGKERECAEVTEKTPAAKSAAQGILNNC